MTIILPLCTATHITVTTVSPVTTPASLTLTGYKAIDEEVKPVCIRQYFAYAFGCYEISVTSVKT
jgi:hypothetical protein